MRVIIDRQGKTIETNYLKIIIGDKEFRITEDKFKCGIKINKHDFNDSGIGIYPSVSNEITLT